MVYSAFVILFCFCTYIKRDRGTIKDFVKQLLFLFNPGFNILIMLAGIFFAIEAWIVNNDKLQDFLNRKL